MHACHLRAVVFWSKIGGVCSTAGWLTIGSLDLQTLSQQLRQIGFEVQVILYKGKPISWPGPLRDAGIINEPDTDTVFMEIITLTEARQALLKDAMAYYIGEFNALKTALLKKGATMNFTQWTEWAARFAYDEFSPAEFDIPSMFNIVQPTGTTIDYMDLADASMVLFINMFSQPMNDQVSALSPILTICPRGQIVLALDSCCFDDTFGLRVYGVKLRHAGDDPQSPCMKGWMTIVDRDGVMHMQRRYPSSVMVLDPEKVHAEEGDAQAVDCEDAAEAPVGEDSGDGSDLVTVCADTVLLHRDYGQCRETVADGCRSDHSMPSSAAHTGGPDKDSHCTELELPPQSVSSSRCARPRYISTVMINGNHKKANDTITKRVTKASSVSSACSAVSTVQDHGSKPIQDSDITIITPCKSTIPKHRQTASVEPSRLALSRANTPDKLKRRHTSREELQMCSSKYARGIDLQ